MRRSHDKHRSKTTISRQSPVPMGNIGKYNPCKSTGEVELGERCFRNVRFSCFRFGWLLTSSSAAAFFLFFRAFCCFSLFRCRFSLILSGWLLYVMAFANFNPQDASIGAILSIFPHGHDDISRFASTTFLLIAGLDLAWNSHWDHVADLLLLLTLDVENRFFLTMCLTPRDNNNNKILDFYTSDSRTPVIIVIELLLRFYIYFKPFGSIEKRPTAPHRRVVVFVVNLTSRKNEISVTSLGPLWNLDTKYIRRPFSLRTRLPRFYYLDASEQRLSNRDSNAVITFLSMWPQPNFLTYRNRSQRDCINRSMRVAIFLSLSKRVIWLKDDRTRRRANR